MNASANGHAPPPPPPRAVPRGELPARLRELANSLVCRAAARPGLAELDHECAEALRAAAAALEAPPTISPAPAPPARPQYIIAYNGERASGYVASYGFTADREWARRFDLIGDAESYLAGHPWLVRAGGRVIAVEGRS